MIQISVVIPVFNEDESITELTQWISRVMQTHGFSYEVILVNDGSTDRSWSVMEELSANFKEIKGLNFTRNFGKSAALDAGFVKATGEVVITMDADLQDSPEEIPELYRMITEEGFDVVSGWKKERHDPITKTIPSRFFNGVTRWISGIPLHDFNCGLKAYKKRWSKIFISMGRCTGTFPYWRSGAGFLR